MGASLYLISDTRLAEGGQCCYLYNSPLVPSIFPCHLFAGLILELILLFLKQELWHHLLKHHLSMPEIIVVGWECGVYQEEGEEEKW